ncbi:MAG: hypothetical protein C0393_06845 [Anaerolinea sp.]|nr:hypothetical protein [Anaerolinea sp.]
MTHPTLIYRLHAVQRMFERKIPAKKARQAIETGETIEDYSDEMSSPSRLILGWRGLRPLHIVTADNKEDNEIIVITVYEPDPKQWEADFRRRKK